MQRTAEEARRMRDGAPPELDLPPMEFGGSLEKDIFGSSGPQLGGFEDIKTTRERAGGKLEIPDRNQAAIESIISEHDNDRFPVLRKMDEDAAARSLARESDPLYAGSKEYLHGVGDAFDAAAAPGLYAGRKIGKGINSILGISEPTQPASDESLLGSDLGGFGKRILERSSGNYGESPNERKGLTSQVIGETLESGSLAADPNASPWERFRGGLGAAAGGGSVIASGGAPLHGKAIRAMIEDTNVARIMAGKRPFPNPSWGDMARSIPTKINPEVFKAENLGSSGGNIFIRDPSDKLDDAEKYARAAAKTVMSRFGKMINKDNWGNLADEYVDAIKDARPRDIEDALLAGTNNPTLRRAIGKVYRVRDADIEREISSAGGMLDSSEVVSDSAGIDSVASHVGKAAEEGTVRPPKEALVEPSDKEIIAQILADRKSGAVPPDRVLDEMYRNRNFVDTGDDLGDVEKAAAAPDINKVVAGLNRADDLAETPYYKQLRDSLKGKPDKLDQSELESAIRDMLAGRPEDEIADSVTSIDLHDKALGKVKASELEEARASLGRQIKDAASDDLTLNVRTPQKSVTEKPISTRRIREETVSAQETPPRDEGRVPTSDVMPQEMRPSESVDSTGGSPGSVEESVKEWARSNTPDVEVAGPAGLRQVEFHGSTGGPASLTFRGDTSFGSLNPDEVRDVIKTVDDGVSERGIVPKQERGVGPSRITDLAEAPLPPVRVRVGRVHIGDRPFSQKTQTNTGSKARYTQGSRVGSYTSEPPGFVNPLVTRNTRAAFRDFGGPLNTGNIVEELRGTISNTDSHAGRVLDAKLSNIAPDGLEIRSRFMPRLMAALQKVGGRIKSELRTAYAHPANRNMEFSRLHLAMDKAAGADFRHLPVGKLSPDAAELVEAAKDGMRITHEEAVKAEAMVAKTVAVNYIDPVTKKMKTSLEYHWVPIGSAPHDETRFLRQNNREFSELIRNRNQIGERYVQELAALPQNKKAGITEDIIYDYFDEYRKSIDNRQAFEFKRDIPVQPDWWTYKGIKGKPQRFQVTDTIDNFLPTKGASGRSIATTLAGQADRASLIKNIGNIHVPENTPNARSIFHDGTAAAARSDISGRSHINTAADKSRKFDAALDGLIGALGGKRGMAGYAAEVPLTTRNPTSELIKGSAQVMSDLAVSMVPLKSATQPITLAAHMPGGVHRNMLELSTIAVQAPFNLGAETIRTLLKRNLGRRVSSVLPDARQAVAEKGLVQDDLANGLMSALTPKPGSQHALNRLPQIAAEVGTVGTSHAFKVAGDIVKRSWDATALASGTRQAKHFITLAERGHLETGFVDLTNRGISNKTIGMLKDMKGRKATEAERSYIIREIAANEAQVTQRNLGTAAQNTRFLNDSRANRVFKFLGYPTMMLREVENIPKRALTTWKMTLDDAKKLGIAANDADLTRIKMKIIPNMIKETATLLVPAGAGGMFIDWSIDQIMNRQDTAMEKKLGLAGKFLQGLWTVNAFGLLANGYDMIAANRKWPRAWADRGGKMDFAGMPSEAMFAGKIADSLFKVGAAAIGKPIEAAGLVKPTKPQPGPIDQAIAIAKKSPAGKMVMPEAATKPKGKKFRFDAAPIGGGGGESKVGKKAFRFDAGPAPAKGGGKKKFVFGGA